MLKTCVMCGKEFNSKYNYAKYCSKTCSDKAYYRQHKKFKPHYYKKTDATKPDAMQGKCYACGRKFKRSFPHEKFCSDACRASYFKLRS